MSRESVMDTLKSLFGDLDVSQKQELLRPIEGPQALSSLHSGFGRGVGTRTVSPRVLWVVLGPLHYRQVNVSLDASKGKRRRKTFGREARGF